MDTNENRLGIMKVTHELLAELLALPANARIVRIHTAGEDVAEITVCSPDFSETENGQPMILVPKYEIKAVTMTDWGLA